MLVVNFFLILVAIVLLLLLGGVSFIVAIIHLTFSVSSGRSVEVSKYFRGIAITIDILGNIVCASLFNLILIKQNSIYKFGERPETVSKVLGMNEMNGSLKKLGKRVVAILNKVEENHCLKATMTQF